jgi:hypothetical protein
MLKGLRVAFWSALGLLAALFIVYLAAKPWLMVNYAQGPLASQFPNMTEQDGVFTNRDHSLSLKLLHLPVKLLPRTDYLVSFTVREVKGNDPVILNLDLFGEGYQFDEQKVRVPLAPGTKDRKISQAIYSGEAVPAYASLRMYFNEAAEVSLGGVRVLGARKHTRRGFLLCVLGCLALLAGLGWAIARYDPGAFLWLRGLTGVRWVQAGFVLVFLSLLLAPAWQKEFKPFYYQPVDENRRLLEQPAGNLFVELFRQGADYSKAYERFFNDHYGFRDFFIKAKNQLDYSLFHRSDEVLIGRDGWMEYRNMWGGQLIEAERLTDRQWADIFDRFERLRAYLAERNVTLVLLPVQLKFGLYPELAPKNLVSRPARSAYDRALEHFRAEPGLVCIRAREALLEGKAEHPIFYRTDFHWNSIGAFYAARETVNTLLAREHSPLRWSHALRFSEKPGFIGGLNRSLALLVPPLENEIVLDPTWPQRGSYLPPKPPFEVHYRADPGRAQGLLPPTLVIGDSYSYNLILTGFYEYFSEAYLLHSRHLHDLPQELPPGVRYVIYEFIEGAYGSALWQAEYWPTYPAGTRPSSVPGPERR